MCIWYDVYAYGFVCIWGVCIWWLGVCISMQIMCMHREVVCMHMGVYAYGCACIWGLCVCLYIVYRVVCASEYGVTCVHCCQTSQKSLGLALLLLLEWTPVDPLCCCGRDC